MITKYEVRFTTYDGSQWFLHTTDPTKIGPWLADMFALFPYHAAMRTNVSIDALQMRKP